MFIRAKATIPASGETETIDVAGQSVQIELCSIYSVYEEVPTFSFDTEGAEKQPIYSGATYQNNKGNFRKIVLHGSDNAEGDEVGFLITNFCMPPNIPGEVLLGLNRTGEDGETQTKLMDDSVQSFSDGEIANSEGVLPTKMYISTAPITTGERGIKFAFNANPQHGKETLGKYLDEEVYEIIGLNWIKAFRCINEVAGETPLLNWTPEY